MEKEESKSDKIYVKDLCLIIKHPGSWYKFCNEIEKYDNLMQLKVLGNLNLKNFRQGRDSFYQAQATKEIGKNFVNRDIKEKLNGFFQKWCGEEIFEEVGDDEYRLHIFVAIGPSETEPIFFFSHDDPKYSEYFENLAIKRGVSVEASKHLTELFQKIEGMGEKLEEKIEVKFEQLLYEIGKQTPRTIFGRRNNYEECTRLISSASKRLYIIERTPVLLFGHRRNYDYEKNFYYAISHFVNKTIDDKNREGILLFSLQDTKKEIERIIKVGLWDSCRTGSADGLDSFECCVFEKIMCSIIIRRIFNNVRFYKQIENTANGSFFIIPIDNYFGSVILADDNFVHLSKMSSTENAFGTYYKINKVEHTLVNIIRDNIRLSKSCYETCKDLVPDFISMFTDYFLMKSNIIK